VRRRTLVAAGLFWLAVACETGPWPVNYLTEAAGHANQRQVRAKLGVPNLTARSLDGGTIWTYHYVRGAPGSAATECLEYALTFDKQGVLRSWIQEDCTETGVEPAGNEQRAKEEGSTADR
jgi:hypothetical protein